MSSGGAGSSSPADKAMPCDQAGPGSSPDDTIEIVDSPRAGAGSKRTREDMEAWYENTDKAEKDKAKDDLDVWDNMLRLYTREEVEKKNLATCWFTDAWGHAHYCLKKDWKYWRESKNVILDAWAFPKPPTGCKEPPYPTPFQVYYLNTKTYALVRGEY